MKIVNQISEADREQFHAFMDEFAKESDRAAVVLGTAKLDLQLFHLLQQFLEPTTNSADELLEGDSPLSSFSSRINACFRLKIIDADLCRALHLIRKIRNSFAHEISGCSLDTGSHRNRTKELIMPFLGMHYYNEFKKWCKNKWSYEEGPRLDFRIGIAIIGARLEGAFHNLTFANRNCLLHTAHPLIPVQWKKGKPEESESANTQG